MDNSPVVTSSPNIASTQTDTPIKKGKGKMLLSAMMGTVLIIAVIGAVAIAFFFLKDEDKEETVYEEDAETVEQAKIQVERTPFANVVIDKEIVTPNVPTYDLGENNVNVANFNRFPFTDEIKNILTADKFAVVERDDTPQNRIAEEFFKVYEQNRYDQIPSFITTDAVLHDFHLVFDDALKTLELTVFSDKISASLISLYATSQEQYDYYVSINDEKLTQAATRNVAYFAVALKLIGEDIEVPEYVSNVVSQELTLINAQEGIFESPVMNLFSTQSVADKLNEDYTQYIPRGHYTTNDNLKRYFQTMMWMGRITFRQLDESENLSALLIVSAMNEDTAAYKNWSSVYDAISFIIGDSDDLGIYEYSKVATDAFTDLSKENLVNAELQTKFIDQIKLLASPSINSIPIYDESINPDRDAQIKGFRVMGQRYTLDADVFQNLIYRSVEEADDGSRRMLPKTLDVMAAMGSETAEELLIEAGDTKYPKFVENLQKMQDFITTLDETTWTKNIYSGWLYAIKPLLEPVVDKFPEFMLSNNWIMKDMNTYQASYTELKHDTVLYAKQAYAEAGSGGYTDPVDLDFTGYVEPRVEVYARLEALSNALLEGLNDRDLLSGDIFELTVTNELCTGDDVPPYLSEDECKIKTSYDPVTVKENLESMSKMSSQLKLISVKELENTALSEDENNFIKEFGAELEHIWVSTLHKGEIRQNDIYTNLDKNPSMLVTDLATDPNGAVLESGTGRLMEIYVIIPTPGGDGTYLRIAKGLVFSQYEFTQPIAERLTDEVWQNMVRNNEVPDLAAWKDYIIKKTNIIAKSVPGSFKNSIEKGYLTIEEAKAECESGGKGVFEENGNVCPENNLDCGKPTEPICKYY